MATTIEPATDDLVCVRVGRLPWDRGALVQGQGAQPEATGLSRGGLGHAPRVTFTWAAGRRLRLGRAPQGLTCTKEL
jgi:hypothetical protein